MKAKKYNDKRKVVGSWNKGYDDNGCNGVKKDKCKFKKHKNYWYELSNGIDIRTNNE